MVQAAARPRAFALALHLPRGTVKPAVHTPFILGRGLHTLDDDPRLSRQLAVLAFDGRSQNATLTCVLFGIEFFLPAPVILA